MMLRSARRPTCFRSSPWPAIPTTREPKTRGTTIDLIIRRNIVARGWAIGVMRVSCHRSWSSQPSVMPTIIAMMIQPVRPIRRRIPVMMLLEKSGATGEGACLRVDARQEALVAGGELLDAVGLQEGGDRLEVDAERAELVHLGAGGLDPRGDAGLRLAVVAVRREGLGRE